MKVAGERDFQAPVATVWQVLNDPAQMAKMMPGVESFDINMDTSFHLSEGAGGTHMKWEADVHILGPVASMGQRVIQPIVNQQVSQVLTALDKQVHEASAG